MIRAAVLCTILAPAGAFAIERSDEEAFRSVVTRQIEAFRRDDAAGAYAFASPGIQQIFPSPGDFLGMVRRAYPPVYAPDTFSFGPTRDGAAGPEQAVPLRDRAGTEWDAIYSFERDAGGIWRISGCRLVKAPGESV